MSTAKTAKDPEMSAAAKKRSAGQPRVGGRFAPNPITVPSIAEAHELASNPKALDLAQKLASVEGERDYWKRLAGERADKIGEVAAQARAGAAKFQEELTEARSLARRWEETVEGCNTEIRDLKTRVENLQALASTARRDADGLQVLLATEEEARRALEATANKRQGEIEEWERVAKGYEAALVAEERAGDSAALVGIGIAAIICTSAGWLLRHFAAVWGWLHG